MKWLPYGVPFESLIFYIYPHLRFLGFKITGADRPFFSPLIFYIDGWDGMDGMGGRATFFFCPYLKNCSILFHNCFRSFLMMFFHIFWNILRKKSECSLFQKISPKSTPPFFVKIFARISQISRKLLNIFSSLFLVPLVEVLRHLLEYS